MSKYLAKSSWKKYEIFGWPWVPTLVGLVLKLEVWKARPGSRLFGGWLGEPSFAVVQSLMGL